MIWRTSLRFVRFQRGFEALVDGVDLLLVFEDPRVGRAELVFGKAVAEAGPGLSTSFADLAFDLGHVIFDEHVGAVALFESLLSTSGSLNASTCPEAFQVVGCMKMAASIPTMFSFIWTIDFHQYSRMFFFSSAPFWP